MVFSIKCVSVAAVGFLSWSKRIDWRTYGTRVYAVGLVRLIRPFFCVFFLSIREGWYRLVERVWSEYTASRIRTKRGQFYLSGYRITTQQSTTNLIRLLFGKLSTDGRSFDYWFGSFSTRTKLGHFTCSKRIEYETEQFALVCSTRPVIVCMCCFGSYEVS